MDKTIFDIDKNMKNNDYESMNLDDCTFYNLNNDYLLGQAFRNDFKRLHNNIFISDNVSVLMKHPSGINTIFTTNSSTIKIKAKLAGAAYMSHMTAVGTIGFSLYVLKKNKWVFIGATKVNSDDYVSTVIKNMDKKLNTYRLYFPLYQELKEAYVGVDINSKFNFERVKMDNLVLYGTSISQGGCAARPGMDYGAILGRMLNLNVINLGFSGSCKIEENMVQILNDIDKKYLILELESNSPGYDHMKEHLSYMLENLKDKDKFDIYLISRFSDGETLVNTNLKKYRKGFRELQMSFPYVKFLNGEELTKELGYEGTVDGAHMTDLGFYHLALKLAKIIKRK
ncbi:MAG: SGNH/GDSL hydrolase family protein [Bacilli bacterium]|nr:SGNH/GDSL hydrolase family protein [Bacilli bacterium]